MLNNVKSISKACIFFTLAHPCSINRQSPWVRGNVIALDVQGSVPHARCCADGCQCSRKNRYRQLNNGFPKIFVFHNNFFCSFLRREERTKEAFPLLNLPQGEDLIDFGLKPFIKFFLYRSQAFAPSGWAIRFYSLRSILRSKMIIDNLYFKR